MKHNLKKEIEKYILGNEELNELKFYLETEPTTTLNAIFKSLYTLLKKYDKLENKYKVESLINFLEHTIKENEINEPQILISLIIELKNKIANFKTKQKILINDPWSRINNLFLEINNSLIPEIQNKKIKYLEYLIFEDKNLSMIESYLKENNNILESSNKNGDNILSLLLRRYIMLVTCTNNSEQINYYLQVILVFFKSKYRDKIIKDSKKYLGIIKEYNCQNEENIKILEELFNEKYSITSKQLEDSYHIKFEFPEIIIHECENFIQNNQKRHDFTYQNCITMDGKSALCLDDALYIEKNNDGTYTLYVHITDIPSLVPYKSLTNEEAKRRGESLYLRDREILLYPDMISNKICSLLPFLTKNVISYVFKLDPHYNLIWNEFDIVEGTIKVAHKMTYEEVDSRIKQPLGEELDNILFDLTCFAEKMKKFGNKKELYREYENIINAQDHHESMKLKNSIAANIVHECMILVNYRSAKLFMDMSLPYIYRKVFLPNDEFIHDIIQKVQKFDSNFKTNEQLLNQIRYSYVKGIYSDAPAYHDGLKLDCYSHSSSPGRRYADSECQYIIHDLIFDKNLTDTKIKTWEYRIGESVEYLNHKKEENEIFSNQYNYLSYKKLIKSKN